MENHYKDMQDVEYTIERGKLGCCKPATANATAQAAVVIGFNWQIRLITKEMAVKRIAPKELKLRTPFLTKTAKSSHKKRPLSAPSSMLHRAPRLCQIYFDADTAERMAKEKNKTLSWFARSPNQMMCMVCWQPKAS
jgi:pyruvate,orthophosphate dikinase